VTVNGAAGHGVFPYAGLPMPLMRMFAGCPGAILNDRGVTLERRMGNQGIHGMHGRIADVNDSRFVRFVRFVVPVLLVGVTGHRRHQEDPPIRRFPASMRASNPVIRRRLLRWTMMHGRFEATA